MKNGGSFHSFLYVYQRVTIQELFPNLWFKSDGSKPSQLVPRKKAPACCALQSPPNAVLIGQKTGSFPGSFALPSGH